MGVVFATLLRWNVRTLLKDTSLAQLAQEFRRYKLKVLKIFEKRWKRSGEQNIATFETVIHAGIPAHIPDSFSRVLCSNVRILTNNEITCRLETNIR